AKAAADVPGEAFSQRERALRLQELKREAEAAAAWQAATAAWKRAGDGPGQVEALCAQALLAREKPETAQALAEQAAALARAETRRPLAAATFLHAAGDRADD